MTPRKSKPAVAVVDLVSPPHFCTGCGNRLYRVEVVNVKTGADHFLAGTGDGNPSAIEAALNNTEVTRVCNPPTSVCRDVLAATAKPADSADGVGGVMDIFAPANFSPCRSYRYSLCRDIEPRFERVMVCCGLNPSVADEEKPDPTITRVLKLARREQCRWLIMVNAYPFVATYPEDLKRCHSLDRTGERDANEDHIRAAIDAVTLHGGEIVAAWGADPLATEACRPWLYRTFRAASAKCLTINKDGSPKHPLYCRAGAPLIPWKVPTTITAAGGEG